MAILSLILGIIGLILSFSIIGIVPAILGLIFGIISLRKIRNGVAIAGVVCSSIGTAIAILMMIFVLLFRTAALSRGSDSEVAEITAPTEYEEILSEYAEPPESEETEDDGVWATSFTPISDFRYVADPENKTIALIRYEGDDKKIMLSPVYNLDGEDYRLVSMGDEACFMSETYITSVYIPNGVTFMGDSCFNSCANLADIYIPASLTDVDSNFLSYLGDYDVTYNETIAVSGSRDTAQYDLIKDDTTNAEELGESMGRAVNGLFGGLNSPSHDDRVVHIHYGGSEEQWNNIFGAD